MAALERMRSLHEELESWQRAAVDAMRQTPHTQKQAVQRGHVVRRLLDHVSRCAQSLASHYDDSERGPERRRELADMSGHRDSVFQAFYSRLRQRDDEDARRQRTELGPTSADYDVSDLRFTGPEMWGRHLDFCSGGLFTQFQNVDPENRMAGYSAFLDQLGSFGDHSFERPPWLDREGRNARYESYLKGLCEYLRSFLCRAQPLFDLEGKLAELEEAFESRWRSGDLDPVVPSLEDLRCASCGMKFAKETVMKGHLASAKHKAKEAKYAEWLRGDARKQVVGLEFKVSGLLEPLSDVLRDTKEHVARKQARTAAMVDREAEAGSDDEIAQGGAAAQPDAGEGEDGEEEEEVVRRQGIANYPVGWDGKPIPYWIYVLQGLGVEFKCEICGGVSYWGRRAYERHFQDWRHTHALSLLGISNSLPFFEIDKIEDALTLWHKIQKDKEAAEWRPDDGEEREDAEGNVFPKKVFEALVNQGLVAPPPAPTRHRQQQQQQPRP